MPEKEERERNSRQILWAWVSVIVISLIGIIAYSNSFGCSFHFDDIPNIVENTAIWNISDVKQWWSFAPSRAIGYLSFALNYHIHRLDVWGYHLVNLAIHIINGLLVGWLVLLTMATPVMKAQPISKYKGAMALFTALLFVSHPLATESVTYIVQRLSSLATLFYLLSLALYIKGRLGAGNKSTPIFFFYAGSLLCAVLGMLTKDFVFTLPITFVLYEFSFIKTDKWKIDLNDRSIQIPVIVLGIFAVLFFFNINFGIFNPIPPLPDQGRHYPVTAWDYFLTQFSVILAYIRLLILPVNQNLDYDYPISYSLFEWHTLLSLLSLTGIFVAGLLLFRRYRLISFGIIWFFIALSVQSSIFPINDVIFEHRAYLPSVCFLFVFTSIVFYFFWDRYRWISCAVLILLVLTNSILTYERNKVWASDYTLWADCVKKSPNKPRALSNYGKALTDIGQASTALAYLDKAINLSPNFFAAYCNRGVAYDALGNYNMAIADFDRAIKLNTIYAKAFYNRGIAYNRLGNQRQAIADFGMAIKINPNYTEAYNNRGALDLIRGNNDSAIMDFDRAIGMNPNYVDAYNNRGTVNLMRGNYEMAIGDFNRAIGINPNYVDAYYNRGIAHYRLGRSSQAIADFKIASKLGNKASQGFLKSQGINW